VEGLHRANFFKVMFLCLLSTIDDLCIYIYIYKKKKGKKKGKGGFSFKKGNDPLYIFFLLCMCDTVQHITFWY
jgi:hypothetical protein